MQSISEIYSGLKNIFRKTLNIPALGILLRYTLSSVFSMPYVNKAILAVSLLQTAIPLLHSPLLNIKLFLKQNCLAAIKLTPIFFMTNYAVSHFIPTNEILSLFYQSFGYTAIFSETLSWETTLFATFVFAPLYSLAAHRLLPWIYSGQKLTSTSTIQDILAFEDGSQLDFNAILNYFHKSCKTSGLPYINLYIIPSPFQNAFAIGLSPGYSCVGINIGLINSIIQNNANNPKRVYKQINAVLSHELGHILNRHVSKMALLSAPLDLALYNYQELNKFLLNLFSRHCEYQADDHAVKLSHSKDLIRALKVMNSAKISPNMTENSFLKNCFSSIMTEIQDIKCAINEWDSTHPTNLNRYDNIRKQKVDTHSLEILTSQTDYLDDPFDEDYMPKKSRGKEK